MSKSPDYAVHPSEWLDEWLETRSDLDARTIGILRNAASSPMTHWGAFTLEDWTHIPAKAWLRYDAVYRADVERLRR